MLLLCGYALAQDLGLTVGDVTASTALVWAHPEQPGTYEVELSSGKKRVVASLVADPERGGAGQVLVTGLKPDRDWTVWLVGTSSTATFRTPPKPQTFRPTTIAWGGDLGGQDVCRDASLGYPVFTPIREARPELFLALGDMIYADAACTDTGRFGNAQLPGAPVAATLPVFREDWIYNLADPGYRALRATTPIVAVWDDHEVVNDFGPQGDVRSRPPYTDGEHLLPIGLRAFREFNPLPESLHRSIRWGEAIELIVLDTRSYRSPNTAPDDASKSMLGAEQERWLIDTLRNSNATWKLVVSSVPLAAPTGAVTARDGWSAVGGVGGYQTELRRILNAIADVDNVVFVTTDVHYAAAWRYRPVPERPDFVMHELVAGPLNAGLFPNREFADDLGAAQLFFHGPASKDAVRTYEEALGWFNFGVAQVTADGDLRVRWRDARGRVVGALDLPHR